MRVEDKFLRWIAEERKALTDVMLRGEPENYPAYREVVGKFIALSQSEQAFLDLLKAHLAEQ
jgi:hypothetical protein